MVGILYCNQSTLDYPQIEHLLLSCGIPATCIAIEDAGSHSLDVFSVLINAMGSFFPEEKIDLLVDFFHSGRNIIHLSAAPFTKSLADGRNYNRVLRSFDIVDDFRPIDGSCAYVQTPDGRRQNINLTGLCSAVYHLCIHDHAGKTVRCAYLEHILDAFDEQNRLMAVPVIRVVTHNCGSMSFFAFDFDTAMLKDTFWQSLLIDLVKKELTGNVLLSADPDFARYYPDEPKSIRIKLENISVRTSAPLSLGVSIYDQMGRLVYEHREEISTSVYETILSPVLTDSSLYQVVAEVSLKDVLIARMETGFLVLSDEELSQELHHFHPMYIDETISTDYCLVDGQPTAILGTTYFVTDVYRECFYDMNAWLCSREMASLRKDGFNVLRSGNWHYNPKIYNPDGSIGKRGKRALQTFFLLAARNNFTVQFALGNVMLNQWDESQSPIHNRGMREKCLTLVRSFAETFGSYPNVVLDIVNEPSYSNKGAWTTARPSGEAGELTRYRQWLREKYDDKIGSLRAAWGESAAAIRSFEDIQMPDYSLFSRNFCRTVQRDNHVVLTDFFAFARNEFLDWTAEVRATVKKFAPDMTVVMGRDETLRIPAQQDEVLAGNVDMVCWHQWHFNANLFTEYLLNRVRGKICVAQELGMYKFDDIRSGKRHTDVEMAAKLEKKLLCSFGNFIQWQAHNDPFMFELCENALGLYHADMSPTPSLAITKELIAAERSMQSHMHGRQDDKIRIATVYNTSYHFSVDGSVAKQGIQNHIYALFGCLKEQSDFMLEHLFHKKNANAIGNPRLIILPAMQTLLRDTWAQLLEYAENGATLLISGCIDRDEYFAEDAKIAALDAGYTTRKLMDFEKLTIGDRDYTLDFRPAASYADASNVLNCGQLAGKSVIAEYPCGKGTILYCPYPIELSANTEAICACYQYAIEKAGAQNEIYRLLKGNAHILLTAASYEDCTVYTLINEGYGDTISWMDLRSRVTLTASLPDIRGCKVWISEKGEVLQKYGKAELVTETVAAKHW